MGKSKKNKKATVQMISNNEAYTYAGVMIHKDGFEAEMEELKGEIKLTTAEIYEFDSPLNLENWNIPEPIPLEYKFIVPIENYLEIIEQLEAHQYLKDYGDAINLIAKEYRYDPFNLAKNLYTYSFKRLYYTHFEEIDLSDKTICPFHCTIQPWEKVCILVYRDNITGALVKFLIHRNLKRIQGINFRDGNKKADSSI